jgi:hypothetical protein
MAIVVANNNSLSAITSLPAAVSGGAMTLISTQTASDTGTISFTSGIDSTYKEYIFKFYDIHPETNAAEFEFNLSADTGSNYNVTKTTTYFVAYHSEADDAGLTYSTGADLAQSTGFQRILEDAGSDNDQNGVGTLHLYDPSNTTFVKNFICRMSSNQHTDYAQDIFVAGYGNTTSAIDAVQFKFSSGNMNGTIKMYGVS